MRKRVKKERAVPRASCVQADVRRRLWALGTGMLDRALTDGLKTARDMEGLGRPWAKALGLALESLEVPGREGVRGDGSRGKET